MISATTSLELTVLNLRYSSWSIRAWLALTHAGAPFSTKTVTVRFDDQPLAERRALGSISGRFPALRVDGVPIHESLAIWTECLERSGGPFLFGKFGIVDCMFFPVLTRFRTYDVALPPGLETYAREVERSPAVLAWRDEARRAMGRGRRAVARGRYTSL